MTPLPWQAPVWERLRRASAEGRLAHALLFTGPPGVGKAALADLLARSLLCQTPDAEGLPCGDCRGCHAFGAGNHPDFAHLVPEAEGKQILVDQVREFSRRLFLSGHYGNRRVGVIDPPEALNANAANSLLKTLEEPPANCHILLISERPSAVMATIRSRCQAVRLALPAARDLQPWLDAQPEAVQASLPLARGAPMRALQLAESEIPNVQDRWLEELAEFMRGRTDPVALAQNWSGAALGELLDWLFLAITDVLKLKLHAAPEALVNDRHPQSLQAVAAALTAHRLGGVFLPRLLNARRLLDSPVDKGLLLEQLLITLWSCRERG